MASITIKATFLAMLALLVAAVLAVATPAQAASNPSQRCSEQGDTIFESPVTHGGCTSFKASGKLTGAAYSAQCKNIEAWEGGFPYTFDYSEFGIGTFTVNNHGECVNTLRYLHTLPLGEE